MSPIWTEPRRRDRGKDEAWIRAFLEKAPYGVLAVGGGDGPPHVNSNLFVFDDDAAAIYVHTARVGTLASETEEPVPATFTVFEMGRLLPADEALEFSVEFASVVARGLCVRMTEAGEKERCLQLLLDKYAPHLRPGRDYRPIVPAELKRTSVYRLDVEEWSGKAKSVDAEFPGAYRYGEAGGAGSAPGADVESGAEGPSRGSGTVPS